MADALFASLMESEKDVRKVMAQRVKAKEGAATTSPALVAAATQRVAPKKPVDMNTELRRLGLGPSAAAPPAIAPAPPAAAPRGPAAAPTTSSAAAAKPAGLNGLLAARKAQVSRAVNTELIGLRTADYDSDDDDDDEPAGGGAAAAPVVAAGATLAREANSLADPNVGVRQRALTRLTELELSNDQLRPLLQPLLLRFSDASERCREVAVALFARWQALLLETAYHLLLTIYHLLRTAYCSLSITTYPTTYCSTTYYLPSRRAPRRPKWAACCPSSCP